MSLISFLCVVLSPYCLESFSQYQVCSEVVLLVTRVSEPVSIQCPPLVKDAVDSHSGKTLAKALIYNDASESFSVSLLVRLPSRTVG